MIGARLNWQGGLSWVILQTAAVLVLSCSPSREPLVTPVSLVWKETAAAPIPVFSRFPLHPKKNLKWYPWKASADTPLLVYDPTRSGVVSGPEQLFGSYTFGGFGRRPGSLGAADVGGAAGERQVPWDSGFAALAALDTDADGRLAGPELDSLSLWFDVNQDGISQRGEVKTLAEAAVETLFFAPIEINRDTCDPQVAIGFERRVSGDLTTGRAVDWMVRGYNSRIEALADELSRRGVRCVEPVGEQPQSEETAAPRSPPRATRPSGAGRAP